MDIQLHPVTQYMHKNQILVLIAYVGNEGPELGFPWKLKRFAPAGSTMHCSSTHDFHGDRQTQQRCHFAVSELVSCKQNWCFP